MGGCPPNGHIQGDHGGSPLHGVVGAGLRACPDLLREVVFRRLEDDAVSAAPVARGAGLLTKRDALKMTS